MSIGSLADARTQPGKSKTVADILTAAADLIEPEGRWTQGAFARSAEGRTETIRSDHAVCFCAVGAIERVSGGRTDYRTLMALDRLKAVARCTDNIGAWNDAPGRTQAEVVAALRQAAEKARQEVSS